MARSAHNRVKAYAKNLRQHFAGKWSPLNILSQTKIRAGNSVQRITFSPHLQAVHQSKSGY